MTKKPVKKEPTRHGVMIGPEAKVLMDKICLEKGILQYRFLDQCIKEYAEKNGFFPMQSGGIK